MLDTIKRLQFEVPFIPRTAIDDGEKIITVFPIVVVKSAKP